MQKILSSKAIQDIDAYTIKNEPIASINLMERAANQAYKWISKNYPSRAFSVFAGPGNNGGDALAIARMLANEGRYVTVFIYRTEKLSPDAATNLKRLIELTEVEITDLSISPFPEGISPQMVAIDGLFGSGLNRPLNEKAATIVSFINRNFSDIVAIDVPSGLFCEDNTGNNWENIIRATFTLSFQMPKLGFLFPENRQQVGHWEVLPIGLNQNRIEETQTPWVITTENDVKKIVTPPHQFAHKGIMGHALLIAGSTGKTGAAILSSRACLKSGVGLLTTHVPQSAVSILQTAVPEAILDIDRSDLMFTEFRDLQKFSAIGIGPGLGSCVNAQRAMKELLIASENKKMVIDADGLNILSAKPEMLKTLPSETILTPHPKEFERLAGPSDNDYQRLEKAINFAVQHKTVLILKGAYTAVISPRGDVWFNTTGNPGMATAGSGDALTGIALALLASGHEPMDAARAAVYIHGEAGDLAISEGLRGMTAGNLIEKIGQAFAKICENHPQARGFY
ncbi:MAG: NAD(P)H-hydrate dehydratase [Marinilabiliaceae bacterium]